MTKLINHPIVQDGIKNGLTVQEIWSQLNANNLKYNIKSLYPIITSLTGLTTAEYHSSIHLKKLQSTNNYKLPSEYLTLDNFDFWLVGFLEGDGYIHSNPKSRIIELGWTQHIMDRSLFEYINIHFKGAGNVHQEGDSKIKFRITGQPNFKNIIYPLLNGKILSEHRFAQFKDACNMMNLPAIKGDHNHPAWLVGYTDADGSFYTHNTASILSWDNNKIDILNIINDRYLNSKYNITSGSTYNLKIILDDCEFAKNLMTPPLLTRKMVSFEKLLKAIELKN